MPFALYQRQLCFFTHISGSSTAWLGHVVVIPEHTGPKIHCRPLHWYLVLIMMDFMLLSLTAAFPLYPVLCGCPLPQWLHPRSSCCVGQVPVQCFLCSDWEVQINGLSGGWGRPIHSPALLPASGVSPLPGQLLKSPLKGLSHLQNPINNSNVSYGLCAFISMCSAHTWQGCSGRGVLKCLHNMEGEILNFINSCTNSYTNELVLIHVPVQWG